MKIEKRNYKFDILRIIAMLMIIIHHCTINDFGLQKILVFNEYRYSELNTFFLMIINSLVIVGVNIFFLLSGYFKIKLKLKKIINIILECFIVFDIVTLIGIKLGYVNFNKDILLQLLNPFSIYWFLHVYLLIVILSPVLNEIIDNTKKKNYKKYFLIILGLFVILPLINDNNLSLNGGYSLLWGIVLYIVGGYIRKFNITNNKGLIFYFLLAIFNSSIIYILYKYGHNDLAWREYNYNNIFVFLESICLFIWFNSIKRTINSHKIITFYASSTLITYLLHSTCWLTILRNYPISKMISMGYIKLGLILLPLYGMFIYTICSIVNLLYINTFQKLINKFYKS